MRNLLRRDSTFLEKRAFQKRACDFSEKKGAFEHQEKTGQKKPQNIRRKESDKEKEHL
jgi:hypothetical protein